MFELNSIVLKDTPLECPFAPNNPNIAPAVIAGIIGGASAIGSSVMNLVSQADANAANERIADKNIVMQKETNQMNRELTYMANAQNYKMFQEQNAFNLDMWNKQNEYNKPQEQVQRLLAAGINPATGLGQVSEAGSLQSASPNAAQAATMQAPQSNYHQMPLNFDFSGVGDAAMQAAAMQQDAKLKESQVNYNNAKAEFEWQSMESRLREQANRTDLSAVQRDDAKRQYKEFMDTWSARRKTIEDTGKLTEKAILEKDEDIRAKRIANEVDAKWKGKLSEASYKEILTGIKEAYSRMKVNDSEMAYKAAQTAVAKAQEAGLKISNEQAEELVDYIVEKADYEAEEANYSAGRSERLYYEGRGAEAPINKLGDAAYPNTNKRKNRTRRWHIRHYDGR